MPRSSRPVVLGLAVLALAGIVAAPIAAGGSTSGDAATTCADVSVPVAVRPGAAKQYHLSAQVCRPAGEVKAALVLVAGATYSRWYWDPSYRPGTYSFVQAANRRGYATVNIDRLGIGDSSRPPAAQVTIPAGAYVVHQVVVATRSGAMLGDVAPKVVTVGHSIGTLMVWQEAARYHDVDGVLGTSLTREPAVVGSASAIGEFGPVQLDPRLGSQNYPPGYITTLPGTRGSAFYNAAAADPGMVRADERHKQTATVGELATLESSLVASMSQTRNIHVPVSTTIGDRDSSYCGPTGSCTSPLALRRFEQRYFAPDACFELRTVHLAGHVVYLHRAGPAGVQADLDWIRDRVVDGRCP